MGNTEQVFTRFYYNYNEKEIKKAYDFICSPYLSSQFEFAALYKDNPFFAEIRMKENVLAMQLNSDSIVSAELMTVVGYYFDQYSRTKNCVYTSKSDNIAGFFCRGISDFIKCGGVITYTFSNENKHNIINMLKENNASDEKHRMYVENFDKLCEMNWFEYQRFIGENIANKEKQKHIDDVTSMELPLDWTNAFSTDKTAMNVSADSPADGLVLCLSNLGRVDIEYIAQITGLSCKEVIIALKGSVYQNPDSWNECFYKGWETADEYLSGRVVEKLKIAKKANEVYKGYFADNVTALQKVIPSGVNAEDIYVTLGSPWVPADVIDDFIKHLTRGYVGCYRSFQIEYDSETGLWHIPEKSKYDDFTFSTTTYGTNRINMFHIIERTLNKRPVVVTDAIKGEKKRKKNKAETLLALEKQKKLTEEFKNWVWTDEERKNRLKKIYEDKYCSSVIRHYDGSFLTFPEMNKDIKLYQHQKNAVARIIFSQNTLLAHSVGAGKTYEMIAAGMEMRRIGISKKNLYVVPNNIVGQWKEMFERLYPNAKVFCVNPSAFIPQKRQSVLKSIANDDYDAIIIAYSCFELIPINRKYFTQNMEEEIGRLEEILKKGKKITAAQKKKLKKAKEFIEEMVNVPEDEVSFQDLGINTLFIDEAHNYKNVSIDTRIKDVLGISVKGSAKCDDMFDKVKIVQKANKGRGVVMATGTPIANSITDVFVMQKYLQEGELEFLDINSFDKWVGTFAEKNSDVEIDVDTTNFRTASRFTRFHNIPELSNLLASIADFYQPDDARGIPKNNGYKDVVVEKTTALDNYLKNISKRADDVRNNTVLSVEDNMLKITTDGRKAALDIRLVDSGAGFDYCCKAAHCAENVYEIYNRKNDYKLTQLIFCDTSTPKSAFNLYDEIKRLLTSMGINKEEIAYVHDATTEKDRDILFEKVRNGEIRILIGSTFKLGLGVNVQDRLYALHHLDVPWRPADMIQREGRILRSGNQNEQVEIYRYITEGSFDAYSWQILESKQKVISGILSGCVSQRMCDELSDTVLDYSEVKAISVGNPLLKKRVEVANELYGKIVMQHRIMEKIQSMEIELSNIPAKIEHLKQTVEKCKDDVEFCLKNHFEYSKEKRAEIRDTIKSELLKNELSTEEVKIFTYRGFDVFIPANMSMERPFVYIQKNGRYRIVLGSSKSGYLIRIDNAIDEMEKKLKGYKENLEKVQMREMDLKKELETTEEHSEEIEILQKELEEIDIKLGVKNK